MDCKVYPMTRNEDAALQEFLVEQQKKNYICPSISLYALPSAIWHQYHKLPNTSMIWGAPNTTQKLMSTVMFCESLNNTTCSFPSTNACSMCRKWIPWG